MSGTDSRDALSVATDDLTLSVDGVDLPVHATDRRIFVEVERVADALRIARRLPDPSVSNRAIGELTRGDLTADIRVRDRTVAVVGADARPGPLSRRLGVAPAEFRLAGVAGAGYGGLSAAVRRARRLVS
ncbi:peptide ABC transporter ATP-binding protein [Halorubrum sp. GN11_10-6_MGM]|uniref:peptide ABC transporter ATP-binding protein n=1 Tax=Halorubrum sp. GN11_10-6_MGM TaxID=2518112 RepID=UPI0010FA1829|nr:peptide ABC transporter ATP-binding protein [Halorubrum sp. GN11_10-6_MGM]TKX72891.1 peptide ABC transporter ATP-binding protein [Halorubrum sp. GN11_10-6_MGM]